MEWEGFEDPESGVSEFEVALVRSTSCVHSETNTQVMFDFKPVPADIRHYTYINIELNVSLTNRRINLKQLCVFKI